MVWTPIACGRQGPGPRSRHGLAYDREAQATVLFGGIRWGPWGGLLADTWELWDGQWDRVKLRNHPAPRHRTAMAYDRRRGLCVLFGGETRGRVLFVPLGDTWTYAGRRWRECRAGDGPRPRPRCGHALAYDEAAGAVVLFGGTPGRDDPSLGDTWLFDGAAWHSVPGPGPPARRYAALGYDPDLGGCVLNGGSEDDDGRCGFGDTWLFRDRAWERLASPFDTEVHDDHGLVYHRAARRLVMFGGLGAAHGARVREAGGWAWVDALPVQARHQCAPLAWDEALEGVVYHGGEAHHAGPQFDTTWVLQLADTAARTTRRPPPPAPPDEPEEETGLGAFFRRIVRRLSGEE